MFTFLPKEYKKDVLRIYHKKVLLIGLSLATVLTFSGCISALPTYLATGAQKKEMMLEKERIESSLGTQAGEATEAKMKEVEDILKLLKLQSDKEPMVIVLEKILSQKKVGIIISGMNIVRSSELKNSIITLEGKASTRDDLVLFSKYLKGEPSFVDVDLPVSSLAKSTEVPFIIRIEAKL